MIRKQIFSELQKEGNFWDNYYLFCILPPPIRICHTDHFKKSFFSLFSGDSKCHHCQKYIVMAPDFDDLQKYAKEIS